MKFNGKIVKRKVQEKAQDRKAGMHESQQSDQSCQQRI
jgi:hypothetical protein